MVILVALSARRGLMPRSWNRASCFLRKRISASFEIQKERVPVIRRRISRSRVRWVVVIVVRKLPEVWCEAGLRV
jgi:hypothetical protein